MHQWMTFVRFSTVARLSITSHIHAGSRIRLNQASKYQIHDGIRLFCEIICFTGKNRQGARGKKLIGEAGERNETRKCRKNKVHYLTLQDGWPHFISVSNEQPKSKSLLAVDRLLDRSIRRNPSLPPISYCSAQTTCEIIPIRNNKTRMNAIWDRFRSASISPLSGLKIIINFSFCPARCFITSTKNKTVSFQFFCGFELCCKKKE